MALLKFCERRILRLVFSGNFSQPPGIAGEFRPPGLQGFSNLVELAAGRN